MAQERGTHFIVTANLTESGSPVYWSEACGWTAEVQKADAIEVESRKEELIRQASQEQQLVCDPYAFTVRLQDGLIELMSAREKIRSKGPTVRVRKPDESLQYSKIDSLV
jgi:hypothetical protein